MAHVRELSICLQYCIENKHKKDKEDKLLGFLPLFLNYGQMQLLAAKFKGRERENILISLKQK